MVGPAVAEPQRQLAEVAGDSAWDRMQHRINTELKSLRDTLAWYGNRAPPTCAGTAW